MATAARLDKTEAAIRDMFGAVAPRYDLLNHLLSACLDVVWRRRAARALAAGEGNLVLDLCCSTGDQALALRRRRARVVAADFCLPMLALARAKYRGVGGGSPLGLAGDALALPLPSGRFDGVTVSFGLRNVADFDRALGEILRVLKPGGRLVALEFALPRSAFLRRLYLLYFHRLLPLLGRLLSPRGSAYRYLPASVAAFPQREAFLGRMAAAGFADLGWEDLSAGVAALYRGRRPS